MLERITERISTLRVLSILSGLLILWGGVRLELGAQTTFHNAVTSLLEGQYETASQNFELLALVPWHREKAIVGRRLIEIISSETNPIVFPETSSQLSRFPTRALFFQALTGHRFGTALALSNYLHLSSPDDWRILKAAVLLEIGRLQDGFATAARARPSGSTEWLWNRIGIVQKAPELASSCFIYDRNGTLLGRVDNSGKFFPDRKFDRGLLPVQAFEELDLGGKSGSVRLTLDLDLSQLALKALRGARGSIVLIEPSSGDILAAVSDSRTYRREGAAALKQMREPASISKLITTSAALRTGLDPNQEISKITCTGGRRYDGGILWCSYRAGKLRSLNRAMALSCNIAFADLGVHIGRPALVDELERFGFNQADGGGLHFGSIVQANGNDRQLADLSIGLEATQITPVHAAGIAATIANEGNSVIPRLVYANNGLLGLSPVPVEPELPERVIDTENLEILRSSMQAVTDFGGTGYGIAPSSFPVAMKTGTAREPGSGYHTNYIGYGPIESPKIAFCVRITHQRTSPRVRTTTVIVARRLLRRFARSFGDLNFAEADHFDPIQHLSETERLPEGEGL